MSDIANRRFDYGLDRLDLADLDADPLRQFHAWLMDAADAGHREPNAMTLATVDAHGRPAARIVLLRGVDERGFTWYTNRASPKGRDLAANPRAALLFHWERLERQVRVDGAVSLVSDEESSAYFAGRPRRSQLAAWASPQSQPLESRVELVSATEHYAIVYPDAVPRPPTWGGYRLLPERFEFWQGRRDRLHDRFAYLPTNDGPDATTAPPAGTDAPATVWRIVRLGP